MITLEADPWATLPGYQPPPPTPPHYTPRWPNTDKLTATTCQPRCVKCRHPEGRGTCRRCLLICDHTTPKKRKLAGVCLVRAVGAARTVASLSTGRRLVVVDRCPFCTRPHMHSADAAAGPYRLAACRQPYLLDLR